MLSVVTALTNKAQIVLDLLRAEGELTAKEVGNRVTDATPCMGCEGSGTASDGARCRRCNGRGTRWFGYSEAYVVLCQLKKRGLATRRHVVDEWGDETPRLVWAAVPHQAGSVDELEALYEAPAAERDS